MGNYLVTGTAGFIGFHLAKTLLKSGENVIGIDNFTPYYPVALKRARYDLLRQFPNFVATELDLCNFTALKSIFDQYQPTFVCHLAAQPGVRYSLTHPQSYVKSNLEAFVNILEMVAHHNISQFVYASSSSVYGNIKEVPFHEEQRIDSPISLYAATKCSDELMSYTYTHLYGIKAIGLRFFTVYGPWGRPDMAIWKFCDSILQHKKIPIYNYGNNTRDFTFISDIVSGICAALHSKNLTNYEIFNLGNNRPENILSLIKILEEYLQIKAEIEMLPPQPGDMVTTFADIEKAKQKIGYLPTTSIQDGLKKFVDWFLQHPDLIAEVRKFPCLG